MSSDLSSSGHGGRREGSGRKPAPTKTIRVPEGTEAAARDVMVVLHAAALNIVKGTAWYQSAPEKFKTVAPEIVFTGVKAFNEAAPGEDELQVPFAVFTATMARKTHTFRLRLDSLTGDGPIRASIIRQGVGI